jgi:hypothetical protein
MHDHLLSRVLNCFKQHEMLIRIGGQRFSRSMQFDGGQINNQRLRKDLNLMPTLHVLFQTRERDGHCLALPESEALPSVEIFAECLLSGTRQRRLCRVLHSVKPDARQRGSLPSTGHSAQKDTRQRLICRVSNTRHRRLSAKGRQRPFQS